MSDLKRTLNDIITELKIELDGLNSAVSQLEEIEEKRDRIAYTLNVLRSRFNCGDL